MRAVRFARYGGSEVLELVEHPDPRPAPGQVVIRMRAASINPRDWMIRSGRYPFRFMLPKLPFVLGSDVAGVVEAVADDVEGLAPGDEVVAMVPSSDGFGAYAELVAVRASVVAKKPAGVSFEDAGALPLAALTALQALRDDGGLRAGQRVVVAGASGGVGHYGVQIARRLGASEVIGVCSAKNADFARELGCDRVIDYREARYEDELRDVDVIFDAIGRTGFARAKKALGPKGVYVSTVPSAGLYVHALRSRLLPIGRRAAIVLVRSRRDDLEQLLAWMADGDLRSVIDTREGLENVRALHDHSRSFRTRGKNVIVA